MQKNQGVHERPRLQVRNIGGIDETSVTFSPGITVLAGRNASNRTSLLQAVMAACGSTAVSLKADADVGSVEFDLDGTRYTRTLARQKDGQEVRFTGDPYLTDTEAADLFAFLLEDNACRRAVARGENLRDLIMAPIDTAEIEAELDETIRRRQEVETEISDIDEKQRQLTELENEREEIQQRLEDKRTELNQLSTELKDTEVDPAEHKDQRDTVEETLAELNEARSDLEKVRYRLNTERESIDALKTEYDDLESTLAELPSPRDEEITEFEQRRERLRDRKARLDMEISTLQNVVQFNERMLGGDDTELLDRFREHAEDDQDPDGTVTEPLVEADKTRCWTCGTEVSAGQISDTINELRELSRRHVSRVDDIEEELDEITDEITNRRSQQDRREDIQQRLKQVEAELERRRATIDELKARKDSLQESISTLEDRAANLESDIAEDVLETHQELNRTEFEITRLEDELTETEEQIEALNRDIARLDELEEERTHLNDRLTDLRTRIERLEKAAVEEFNDQMETVLELLDYENIERIWLERRENEVPQGRREASESRFDMHIVRSTKEDTVYEDTIRNLSESEREVAGLVFALAGYLTHDVYEQVPFMLLDSLEAIDSERIALLLDHFKQYADYLIVALLEEDAQALSDEYHRIEQI